MNLNNNYETRQTIEIGSKKILQAQAEYRAMKLAAGELVLSDEWDEPTGVYDIPPMLELVKLPREHEHLRICYVCRDDAAVHGEQKCSSCISLHVDNGWNL